MRHRINGQYTVRVYSPTGKRLYNCRPARARKLLRNGRAALKSGTGYFGIILKEEKTPPWNP